MCLYESCIKARAERQSHGGQLSSLFQAVSATPQSPDTFALLWNLERWNLERWSFRKKQSDVTGRGVNGHIGLESKLAIVYVHKYTARTTWPSAALYSYACSFDRDLSREMWHWAASQRVTFTRTQMARPPTQLACGIRPRDPRLQSRWLCLGPQAPIAQWQQPSVPPTISQLIKATEKNDMVQKVKAKKCTVKGTSCEQSLQAWMLAQVSQ